MADDRMAAARTDELERLNAFVDGELSADARAQVAARIAADPDFARTHATLTRLRAGLSDYAVSVPPASLKLPPPRRSGLWPALALSAATITLLVVAALGIASRQDSSVHVAATQLPVLPAAFGARPIFPDLAAAGLTLVRVDASQQWPLEHFTAVYTGPRGCRLELHVRADGIAAPAIPFATHHRAWQVGPLIYELFAFGMPAKRFGVIADGAEQQIRALSPKDSGDFLLREARVNAPPCTG
jgi:hypothetical protein